MNALLQGWLGIALAVVTPVAVFAQAPARRPLVYGGNSGFPPYEFLDENGQPQGFGVELVRAISRATGTPIEVRLAPWSVTLRAFEAGDVDFVSLTRTADRENRYEFLAQYWTHRYVAAFARRRSKYPQSLREMRAEVVALQRDSVMHELIQAMPPSERPPVVPVTHIEEAVPLLGAGEITAVVSSELTIKLAAAKHNLDLEFVTIQTSPFYFAARKGSGTSYKVISEGLEKIRRSGEYEEILESWVVDILPVSAWDRYGRLTLLLALAVLAALLGAVVWNRSLRVEVKSRTQELEQAVRDKEQEVEEHRLAEAALDEVTRDRKELINTIDGIVWERDVTWRGGEPCLETRFVSSHASRMLGYPVERWLSEGGFWVEHIHPADRERVSQAVREGVLGCADFRLEYRMLAAGGSTVWIRDVITVSVAEGRAVSLRGIMIDITSEKQALEELTESERRYRELVEGSPDAILIVSRDEIVYANPAAVDMLGAANADDILGRAPTDLVHPDFRALVAGRHALVAQSQTAVPVIEQKILKLDGDAVDVEASAAPFREGGHQMIRVTLRDITKRKEAEQQLLHMAFHDPLTQLPNRALLFERLRHRMALSERFGDKGYAVLFLDLDEFKMVNDSLGHWMGDLLLLHVRDRIRSVLNPWDTLARLGGDEFTILIEEVSSAADAAGLSDRVHAVLAPAIELGGHELFVTASIGVALSTTGYEEAEEVLRDADTAMYSAKAKGRARTVFFDHHLRVSAVASLALERDLRLAARANQFVLHYQPVVSLTDGAIKGVEALLRWRHPRRGLLVPGEFLARANEGGLITQLDAWAIEQGCRQASQWDWVQPGVRLSVNVSGKTLLSAGFAAQVLRYLENAGLSPHNLALEITEQVLVESTQCISDLEKLRAAGVELHLDDFGTGYSSLSYLTMFPISRLKIDRSFIHKLEEEGGNLTVVRMVLGLAEGLGLEVTAEGVETGRQSEVLRTMGCQSAQGHFFWAPMDAVAVDQAVRGYCYGRTRPADT